MKHTMRKLSYAICGAVICATAAMSASAVVYPSPTKRYTVKPMSLCDQGMFFVGGVLKTTNYVGATASANPGTLIVGQMYVNFQIPNGTHKYPLILISGGGHTGACLESTPDGREGWMPYALRRGLSVFNVDQAGRGRSGFDASLIHEAKATNNVSIIPAMLSLGPNSDWTNWFGRLVVPGTATTSNNILTGQLVPHGDPVGDPTTAPLQYPYHTISEPLEPKNLVKVGTWGPPPFGPADLYKLDYYKQTVPNAESTLPGSMCPSCSPTSLIGGFGSGNTWTPVDVAELVEQLGKTYGGAILATHSQSGPVGHHLVRVLREDGLDGKCGDPSPTACLSRLKGLISVEPTSCSLTAHGLTAADFDDVPYLAVKGDYSGTSATCTATTNAIIARRLAGQGTAAVEYLQFDEPPNPARAWPAPLSRPVMLGTTHMIMVTSNEGLGYDSSDVMGVLVDWATKYIPNPPAGKNNICGNAFLPAN